MSLTYGNLFAGYGGLEMGVQSVLGGTTSWFAEFDKAPSRILAHHHPGVPNLGDVTKVDWTKVPRVDVLTAGYPCQPFSHAGKRQGTDDERHLWPYIAEAVAILRPRLCVFENVRGHLTLGFDEVLRDLQQLGYSVRWYMLRAADIGAPHGRARLFIFAEDMDRECAVCGGTDRRGGLDRGVPHEGGHLHDPGCRGDGHQGHESSVGHARFIRRPPFGDEARVGAECREDTVDRGRGRGGELPRHGGTAPDPQGPAGAGRTADVGGPGGEPEGARTEALDAGTSSEVRGSQAQDSRTELPWAEASPAAIAEREPGCGVPLGMVVGAGGRPVRAGGVRGEAADVRPNGRRACLCDNPVGAPHGRFRVFLFATPADAEHCTWGEGEGLWAGPGAASGTGQAGRASGHRLLRADGTAGQLLPTPRATDGTKGGPNQRGSSGDLMPPSAVQHLLPTPEASRNGNTPENHLSRKPGRTKVTSIEVMANGGMLQDWREYEPAIRRWEHVLGRPAPAPTEPGAKGQPRLSPAFVEWMQGLPEGHVTDPAIGISRNDQLKALGNGVVPQQCAAATRAFIRDTTTEAVAS